MRKLSDRFMEDLKSGTLEGFLDLVHHDDTLCMELRDEYVNIYYRGGSLYKIASPRKNGEYRVEFNEDYAKSRKSRETDALPAPDDLSGWLSGLAMLKSRMDAYFILHPKPEREIQQQIVRENNQTGLAGDTDYFITDMELALGGAGCRFDMTAMKWLSDTGSRRSGKGIRPVFIELKFGNGSIDKDAGLEKHIDDMATLFLDERERLFRIKEIESLFNQKFELKLIHYKKGNITVDPSARPEIILALANYKPASSVLEREIQEIFKHPKYIELTQICDIRVACSSFMGYGLYDRCMISLEDCLRLLRKSPGG